MAVCVRMLTFQHTSIAIACVLTLSLFLHAGSQWKLAAAGLELQPDAARTLCCPHLTTV